MARVGDEVTTGSIRHSAVSCRRSRKRQAFRAWERFYPRFCLRPCPLVRILKDMAKDRNESARALRDGRLLFSFMAGEHTTSASLFTRLIGPCCVPG